MEPVSHSHRTHGSKVATPAAKGKLSKGTSVSSKFQDDVLSGLRQENGNKKIATKYLYDDAKPEMFDRLTHIPAYYPTNADIRTLQYHINEIVGALPDRCIACEIGGNSRGKTIPLLQACINQGKVSSFIQIDICDPTQSTSVDEFNRELVLPKGTAIELKGICGDTDSLDFAILNLPKPDVAFVFGLTAFNCNPKDIPARLGDWAKRFGKKIFISAGTIVDDQTFLTAYNEPEAVHVEWFFGLLERINRELNGTFDLEKHAKCTDARDPYKYWAYEIELNKEKPWKFISMYLTSKQAQSVQIAGEIIEFKKGERIHVADTCRIDPRNLPDVLGPHGLVVEHAWVDPRGQSAIYSISKADCDE